MTAVPTDLLGRWSLQRRVDDRISGLRGRVEGTLDLLPDGPDVRWLEHGRLTWDGGTVEVSRELRLVRVGTGDWTVTFADGREFHPWRPGRPVTHPCRADLYRGLIVVDPDRDRLRIGWRVTGPAKDQRLITRCRRLADTGLPG